MRQIKSHFPRAREWVKSILCGPSRETKTSSTRHSESYGCRRTWALSGAGGGRGISSTNLLLGHDLKARKLGDANGGRHRGVRGVTTASHDNAADAGMVVTRVYRVPTAIEKDFGPGAEIHGIGINRNADVAEIAGAIPRGNVHAAGERYGEMREV